mgnify:CR=1 FL=1
MQVLIINNNQQKVKSFQSSLLRNFFCKHSWTSAGSGEETIFQSSLLRNFFCKRGSGNVRIPPAKIFQSSLLRNFFCKAQRYHSSSRRKMFLSILVTEELLLQVALDDPVVAAMCRFQSSLLRNFFCKKMEKTEKMEKKTVFQSSLLRNFFCKLQFRQTLPRGERTFNPRY